MDTPKNSLYDVAAEQRHAFIVEEDESQSTIVHICRPFNNLLEDYDRMREVTLQQEGKETEIETASIEADEWLFGEIIKGVEGYDGDLPEDFAKRIDIDEKQATIRQLLSVKVLGGDGIKAEVKRTWGQPNQGRTIKLLSYFNGEEVESEITFKAKDTGVIADYERVKGKVNLKEGKRLNDSKMKIPAQMVAKGKIFKNMVESTTGYANDIVPLHHQAMALSSYFEKTIKNAAKK